MIMVNIYFDKNRIIMSFFTVWNQYCFSNVLLVVSTYLAQVNKHIVDINIYISVTILNLKRIDLICQLKIYFSKDEQDSGKEAAPSSRGSPVKNHQARTLNIVPGKKYCPDSIIMSSILWSLLKSIQPQILSRLNLAMSQNSHHK